MSSLKEIKKPKIVSITLNSALALKKGAVIKTGKIMSVKEMKMDLSARLVLCSVLVVGPFPSCCWIWIPFVTLQVSRGVMMMH